MAKSSFAAAGWLQTAVDVLDAEARQKSVSVVLDAQEATLEGDVSLLTSALVNLVKNAVQTSSAGMTVRVTGRSEPGRYRVEVSDQGTRAQGSPGSSRRGSSSRSSPPARRAPGSACRWRKSWSKPTTGP